MKKIKKSVVNKKKKFETLISNGMELFTKNGLLDVSIDQITKKAGVAKGTFYLYFKNKTDFIDQIVFKLLMDLLESGMIKANENSNSNPVEYTLEVADYLVNYYSKNPKILKLIYRHFSWSNILNKFYKSRQPKILYKTFRDKYKDINIIGREVNHILFILIQLTGSVCYESIINHSPAPIEEMSETLMRVIKKILIPLELAN
jgi:Transcriptional regulator